MALSAQRPGEGRTALDGCGVKGDPVPEPRRCASGEALERVAVGIDARNIRADISNFHDILARIPDSVATQVVSLVAVVIYAVRELPRHSLFQRFWRPDWEMFARVFRFGLPLGLTTLADVSLFATSAVMMGWLGQVPLAAYGIALNPASATFMVHLGLLDCMIRCFSRIKFGEG